MSAKNLDRKKRWRNATIAFRVSEVENQRINNLVKLSGMTKQDYITTRLENETMTVVMNSRIHLQITSLLKTIYSELCRLSATSEISEELQEQISLISNFVNNTEIHADI